MKKLLYILVLSCISVPMIGCSGLRTSYESQLDTDAKNPTITLKVGDKQEILAIGRGFPGYWGYYPAIVSHDQSVAGVDCEEGRSMIPFREPGIIFGGETCYLEAHKVGVTWLLRGNLWVLQQAVDEFDLDKVTDDEEFPPTPDYAEMVIKVRVKE